MNPGCYLSRLGNCSGKITREHFISRNILERITDSKLKFDNAAHFFGGKETVEVGIDAFTAKVLCDNHNSLLSPLDTAAGLVFSTVERVAADLVATQSQPINSFHLSSGRDIERWLIKVYCGLAAAGKLRGITGRAVGSEHIHLTFLESLIGNMSLPTPWGLYMHTFPGQTRTAGGLSFGTIQLTDGSEEVGGLLLSLSIMSFALVTSPKFGQSFTEPNWYRHQALAWNVRQQGSRLDYLFTY